jgi:predicted site-specific integrase-resolvase
LLSAGAGAREAGVAQATLLKWADAGELKRHDTPAGWRFQREAVRERARSYWKTVRFKRATPPDWLAAELRT